MEKEIVEVIPEIQPDHVEFDTFEKDAVKEIKKNKIFYLDNGKFSFKRFLATIITTTIANLMSKRTWQVPFFIWIMITIPVGTWVCVKWIINLF